MDPLPAVVEQRLDRERVAWFVCVRPDGSPPEFPPAVSEAFAAKYDGWDICSVQPDGPRVLLEVETTRWLFAR